MRRREFITLLGGATATWPLAARAQQPGKVARIGYLGLTTPSSHAKYSQAFRDGLRRLGYVEGTTSSSTSALLRKTLTDLPLSRPS